MRCRTGYIACVGAHRLVAPGMTDHLRRDSGRTLAPGSDFEVSRSLSLPECLSAAARLPRAVILGPPGSGCPTAQQGGMLDIDRQTQIDPPESLPFL